MTGLTGAAGGGGPKRGGRDGAGTEARVTGVAAVGGGWFRVGAARGADQLPTSGRDVTRGGD